MYKLKIILLFVLIQLLPIFHLETPSQETISDQSLSTLRSESKLEQPKSHILPLVQIKYLDRFIPPTKIENSTWKKGEKFLTAETTFSGSIPGKQTFFCGKDSNDEYCSFPVDFETSDILQCTQEPKPFLEKLLIKDSVKFIDVPCGENKRGRIYRFIYKICTMKDVSNDSKQNNVSGQKWGPIETLGKVESFSLCLDIEKKELLYTRHKLQSLYLLSDKRLKQERQMSYDMITDGYTYFSSWFEEIKQQYELFAKRGYKPMKLVPSNHFPLASWKKPTYHYLNTMPIRKNLRKLWEHIFNRIRQDGIDKKRQYKFHTRAFPIESLKGPAEGIVSPDVWITLLEYIQRDDEEEYEVAVAIILNNKFEEDPNYVTEFITNTYCKENLCEKTFPEPFANISQSVHCCAINDTIKALFETTIGFDRVLMPDFIFDSEDDSVDDSPQLRSAKTFSKTPSSLAEFGTLLLKTWT